jgi:hypothetical protein
LGDIICNILQTLPVLSRIKRSVIQNLYITFCTTLADRILKSHSFCLMAIRTNNVVVCVYLTMLICGVCIIGMSSSLVLTIPGLGRPFITTSFLINLSMTITGGTGLCIFICDANGTEKQWLLWVWGCLLLDGKFVWDVWILRFMITVHSVSSSKEYDQAQNVMTANVIISVVLVWFMEYTHKCHIRFIILACGCFAKIGIKLKLIQNTTGESNAAPFILN